MDFGGIYGYKVQLFPIVSNVLEEQNVDKQGYGFNRLSLFDKLAAPILSELGNTASNPNKKLNY